jgi:acetyl esterase/lipase
MLKHTSFLLCAGLLLGISAIATSDDAPTSHEGAETHVFAERPEGKLYIHVVKPKGWTKTDKRPGWIHFYGGGWVRGDTSKSIGWARSASKKGFVGFAPDYRVNKRHGTKPHQSVADARAALRWVQEHAEEFGIDPERIVISGNSAGGHVALWTAIEHAPPGSSPDESPLFKPSGLILSSPVADTSFLKGYRPKLIGENPEELSPVHQLDEKMPPILLLHGTADKSVPYQQAVDLNAKMVESGNEIMFITIEDGEHNFRGQFPEWKQKTRDYMKEFTAKYNLDPQKKKTETKKKE